MSNSSLIKYKNYIFIYSLSTISISTKYTKHENITLGEGNVSQCDQNKPIGAKYATNIEYQQKHLHVTNKQISQPETITKTPSCDQQTNQLA